MSVPRLTSADITRRRHEMGHLAVPDRGAQVLIYAQGRTVITHQRRWRVSGALVVLENSPPFFARPSRSRNYRPASVRGFQPVRLAFLPAQIASSLLRIAGKLDPEAREVEFTVALVAEALSIRLSVCWSVCACLRLRRQCEKMCRLRRSRF